MITVSGLLALPPRSPFPPPQGYGQQANCQLVADDGHNWLLADPSGQLAQLAGQRCTVWGHSDGHGLLVVAAAADPLAAALQPGRDTPGEGAVCGCVQPAVAADDALPGQPRHVLHGPHGAVWLLAPGCDLDGLSGNWLYVTGFAAVLADGVTPVFVATTVRILPTPGAA